MNEAVKQKIEELVGSDKVFLFMKGTPDAPMCGFSAGVANVLRSLGIQYGSFNVLSDEVIRQGIKDFANWPTIPQLYINGEFIGGHDIVVEMAKSGDLQKKVGTIPA
ncbi:Grx4 family monothiol glutaredoxin [Leptospira stimsonii]|uniref:Glutaredoxin n=1 Tax=Leptospira stimsonii TaxID=2202203 RepID=A0A4R9L0Y8_9LEPT|nr:Grx4 family monothiol glutaredoxin [Leptospira stimsonii]RHX86591.1 Grx4 family monothiol glutaredoxin [Leptospira stimsonii]RHX90582.1 Grx4 family monothiol glutaredoxin [Leptospira stimsonii]TGK13426.1 Grx4 family monothiol glutaredoxin [Leptospira stimsonii]TGM11658.1 Grx4 family monothiol glutaredoxin [Leptospira stimsonii]